MSEAHVQQLQEQYQALKGMMTSVQAMHKDEVSDLQQRYTELENRMKRKLEAAESEWLALQTELEEIG